MKRLCCLVAIVVLSTTAAVRAEVIYSNFGPELTFDTGCFQLSYCGLSCWNIVDDNILITGGKCWPSSDPNGYTCSTWQMLQEQWEGYAQQFTPTVTASFTKARVALYLASPTVGVRVVLYDAGADGRPGSVLEEIWVRGMDSGVFTADSVLHPQLRAGSAYWLGVMPAPLSSYPDCVSGGTVGCGSSARWCQNSTGDLNAGTIAYPAGSQGWYLTTGGVPPWETQRARAVFQIEGDTEIAVAIDVKPGSVPNSVNPKSRGVIPVAILSGSTFAAPNVDPLTVRFGSTGLEAAPAQFALENVDGDGYLDMVLHFRTEDSGIVCGTTTATLTGMTTTGQKFRGTDSIETVGCR
jgi:hypothetical protein